MTPNDAIHLFDGEFLAEPPARPKRRGAFVSILILAAGIVAVLGLLAYPERGIR